MKRITNILFLLMVSTVLCFGQSKSASVSLKGRTVLGTLPRPTVSTSVKGTVVVTIKVDQYGNVTEAIPGAEGTTVTDKSLWNAARNAAMKAHFNMVADAPSIQTGTISYYSFDSPTNEELTSIKDFVEEKNSGEFTVCGKLHKIHDYDDLVLLLEQDDYIIPIQLVKKDLGVVNRFRSLHLTPGDVLTVKGRLSSIYIDTDSYKGLVNATILDRVECGIIHEETCTSPGESIPFQLVEQKPSFNGGDANEFSKWVNSHLVYPRIAKNNGIQGRVTVQFTIETDGKVTNVKVIRSVEPSLDAEAVRVISSSPKWTPGRSRNKAVPVIYTFPVIFQLR